MRDQKLWFWHVAAGIVILVFLALHMTIMHLDGLVRVGNPAGGHPIDWANVVARGKGLFFPATYVVLLGAALFHGLYGLRNIIFEVASAPGVRTVMSWLLILVGLAVFAVGTWAALASHQVALAA